MKTFEIHNLATTNAILMKLTAIMYLHETFHWLKIGASPIGHKKALSTSENQPQNELFQLIFWNFLGITSQI